jgi:HEPN domain-containing protein
MVRIVKKHEAENYLAQAEEFLDSARNNLIANRLNASGFDAIQAIINANDALTIHFLEKRASADHREAVQFHIEVVKIVGDSSQRNFVKQALDMRSEYGYLGKGVSREDTEYLIKGTIKFINWVRKQIE